MDKQEKITQDYYSIDIVHLLRSLWKRAWLIVIVGFVGAAIGFSIAKFAIAPTYSSSIMLYINNSSISLGNTSFSISSSEITAAQSLVKTYGEILNNRTTLQRVGEKLSLPYSYKELSDMIKSSTANDTEIMKVTVTSKDPYHARDIANCIAEVLPERIAEIIDGASMEVVDSAVVNLDKVNPSISKYTAIGMMIGVLLICAVLIILAIMDDTIHDEDYVLQTYDYPILAKIPGLVATGGKQYGGKHYGYYSYYKSRSTDK